MLALLDGDIIGYRCAASAENDPVEIALIRTDRLLQDILHETGASSFKCYLTGSSNFRKELFPDYKANRKQPRPTHLEACRQFLCKEYGAVITDGHEADDELGINQLSWEELSRTLDGENNPTYGTVIGNSIICSIDKDLLQIPGRHYNFVKKEFKEVLYIDGIRHFYAQMLIGDRSDNVTGVEGIGEKKAAKLLNSITNEEEMFDCVRELYKDDYRFLLNGQLLWIWREYKGIWQPIKSLSIGTTNETDLTNEEIQETTT